MPIRIIQICQNHDSNIKPINWVKTEITLTHVFNCEDKECTIAQDESFDLSKNEVDLTVFEKNLQQVREFLSHQKADSPLTNVNERN